MISPNLYTPLTGIKLTYDNIRKVLHDYFLEVFEVEITDIEFLVDDEEDLELVFSYGGSKALVDEMIQHYEGYVDYPKEGYILLNEAMACELIFDAARGLQKIPTFCWKVFPHDHEIHFWWEVKINA